MREIEEMAGSKVKTFGFPFGDLKDGTGQALRHIHEHVQKVFHVHGRTNKQASDQFIFRSSIRSMEAGEPSTELEAMGFIRRILAGLRNNHPLTVRRNADAISA